jgi:hypothetical protein
MRAIDGRSLTLRPPTFDTKTGLPIAMSFDGANINAFLLLCPGNTGPCAG